MSDVKHITAEIGTSGRSETVACGPDYAAAISVAIELEHPCEDTSGCDIARALEDGYPLWAAHLLQGATETPLLDAVVSHYFDSGAIADWERASEAERVEWLSTDTWTEHAHKCDACGGYTFGDDYWTPEQCENCLAPLAPKTEEN
jgi:hypothetical protein